MERLGPLPVVALLLLVGIVAGLIVAFVVWQRRQRAGADQTDYRELFLAGVGCLLGGGVMLLVLAVVDASLVMASPLVIVGITYTSLGWSKRARWQRR
jgi:Na+-transporting NADH:ubiquinone oxidoreductase subunit NqrD